jgi:HAD superfamily hydrolase (TIGR01548 family)
VANVIRNAGNPYPVSALSIAVVLERLRKGEDEVDEHIGRIQSQRAELRDFLDRLGIASPQSEGNFVFAELGDRAQFVHEGLASLGVLVRFFPHREETRTGLRISLTGYEEDFARLLDALQICLAPEALLFDMDGVLANVENSYRRSTLETARSFGLNLERQDLERAVLEGDANNDWYLTQRLLAGAGIEVSFDEIYERYQSFYLGTHESPGLRESETLLVEREVLETLAMWMPLAVVTGRPREEAEWFLNRVGISDLFSTAVCLEDGPNKPDPTPVRIALDRLGVSRAWMVGDTPDDVRAAVAAGVLPLGIVAPGADASNHGPPLKEAGAVTILDDVASIRDLLQ